MIFLLVSSLWIIHCMLFCIVIIDIAKLEETKIRILAFYIIFKTLQSAKQQCLTHHIKIGTQRIHNANKMICMIVVESFVVVTLCKRVVQYLIESTSYQLLSYKIFSFMFQVFLTFYHQGAFQLCWYLYVVIAINPQDILNHVAWTLHVNTISWYLKFQTFGILIQHLHLKRFDNALYHIFPNDFTNKRINVFIL